MDKIRIHGGHPLSGSIKISGSKNSALPILAATLLTREPCILHRVPDLSDTHYMLQILMHLGAEDAGLSLRAGSPAGTLQRGDRLAPRRLHHWRPPDRFASQGLRSARCSGACGKWECKGVRAETYR